jgi:hypothetical protein
MDIYLPIDYRIEDDNPEPPIFTEEDWDQILNAADKEISACADLD